jgi:hypothetical protein
MPHRADAPFEMKSSLCCILFSLPLALATPSWNWVDSPTKTV